MANIIEDIPMSNGLTSVFLEVLILSGSMLARTMEEKRLIVWLAERDQSRVGLGTVGFDLCDMPWNSETFEEDKAFLLQAVSRAKERLGWKQLGYSPNEAILFPCLDRFAERISRMDAAEIRSEIVREWLTETDAFDPVLCGFPTCPEHHTLLTIFGCYICNNEGGRGI